jgi:hypothetical protein
MKKDPGPDKYLRLTDLAPDPGGPKTYGSYGSGSGTLDFKLGYTHSGRRPNWINRRIYTQIYINATSFNNQGKRNLDETVFVLLM